MRNVPQAGLSLTVAGVHRALIEIAAVLHGAPELYGAPGDGRQVVDDDTRGDLLAELLDEGIDPTMFAWVSTRSQMPLSTPM